MAKNSMGKNVESTKIIGESGYYMYADGLTHWGIGLMRNGEIPFKTTEAISKVDVDKRIEWHKEEYARIQDKAKADAEKAK